MLYGKAAKKGIAMSRPLQHTNFEHYDGKEVCACVNGAAFLGAGMSVEQALRVAEGGNWPAAWSLVPKIFPEAMAYNAAVHRAALRRWPKLRKADLDAEPSSVQIAVELNDYVGVSREEIAEFLIEQGV